MLKNYQDFFFQNKIITIEEPIIVREIDILKNFNPKKIIIKSNLMKITGIKSGSVNQIRELVRIRDNHTCQSCKKVWIKGARRFDVHHLDKKLEGKSNKGMSAIDRKNTNRMITLCHRCHLRLDKIKNKRLLKTIQSIIK